jgi:Flp pilus assembly protein TadD
MDTEPTNVDFFVIGGALKLDSLSYVKRPADDDLYNSVWLGKFCYVLTPRQMGKSSLMVRTAYRLQQQGVRTAIIDLADIGSNATEDQWYWGMLSHLRDGLGLSLDLQAWWDQHMALGAVQRFTAFLRDIVLQEIPDRVVIFVDEIDTTLSLGFSDDFFAAIRSLYNARAYTPNLDRLTFVLLGVTTPTDLIRNRRRTPFNIGHAIDLSEFTHQDAQVLRERLSAICPEQADAVFTRIFDWTNGHPYLTQTLCQSMTKIPANTWNVTQVDGRVHGLFLSDETRLDTNLQNIQRNVAASPQRRRLLALYHKVHQGKTVSDDERSLDHSRLKLIGLVRAEKGLLKVRNEIYRQVFSLGWILKNTPVDWTRRIAIVSTALVLLLVGVLAYSAFRQRQQTAQAQAQLLMDNFRTISSAEVRITSLAGLFRLPGYADTARQLFQSLSQADKLALFNLADPKAVSAQLIVVVKGLYTDLKNDPDDNELLRAMPTPLGKLDDPTATNLATEIEQWLQGRASYDNGDDPQAVMAYNVAIRLNPRNPGTCLDRALAYAHLGQFAPALTDLDTVLSLNSTQPWKDRVQLVLENEQQLYGALWSERDSHPALVALVPVPTNTPIPTPISATLTPIPTDTPPPTLTPPSTAAPTTISTRLPTGTPTRPPVSGQILFTSNLDLYSVNLSTGQIVRLGPTDSDNSTCNGGSIAGIIGPDSRKLRVYRSLDCPIGNHMARCPSPNLQWQADYYDGGIVQYPFGRPNEGIFVVQGNVNESKGIRWAPNSSGFIFYLRGNQFTLAIAGKTGHKQLGNGEVVTWSPDGSMLLLQEPNDISIYRLQDGTRQTLINGQIGGGVECPVWAAGPP